jgi:hypothetical protein
MSALCNADVHKAYYLHCMVSASESDRQQPVAMIERVGVELRVIPSLLFFLIAMLL